MAAKRVKAGRAGRSGDLTKKVKKGGKSARSKEGKGTALSTERELDKRVGEYGRDKRGLWWVRKDHDGNDIYEQLTNFSAEVSTDIIENDGHSQRRFFLISARLAGKGAVMELKVPAASFDSLGWVPQELGAKAIIHSGQRGRTRVAILMLSGKLKQVSAYTHSGWIRHNAHWVFLSESGALGKRRLKASPRVALGQLSGYRLPDPSGISAKQGRRAIRRSLDFLKVGPPEVVVPLLAAAYRAPIQECDFGLFVEGDSGVYKSALTALIQQHFGPTMDDRNFPASWSSTDNALEALAFLAKDVVFTIDDFKPAGSRFEIQQMHSKAERIFRGLGNSSGRQRLSSAGKFQETRYARGLVVSSGEDVPTGKSLRARMLILGIEKGTVDLDVLTGCQELGRDGTYAVAMSLYVSWIAARRDRLDEKLRRYVTKARHIWSERTTHGRTPDIIGNLLFGYKCFLDFASEMDVLKDGERRERLGDAKRAFRVVAATQSLRQLDADEVSQFFTLLKVAIATGMAHVATVEGEEPMKSQKWGWHASTKTVDHNYRGQPQIRTHTAVYPKGVRIGWVKGHHLYLAPDAAFAVAQSLSQRQGRVLSVGLTTLKKRLRERGLLVANDSKTKRKTITVRKTVQGMRLEVLHFATATFLGFTGIDLEMSSTSDS